LRNFNVFFKRPLTVKFSEFCSEDFHRDTDPRVFFVKFGLREIGKTVRCLRDKKQNKISPGSPAVATAQIAPKICRGEPPTTCSECSRFHPNRFTFDGVTAERVNTATTRRKMNPIFGRNLYSSRI